MQAHDSKDAIALRSFEIGRAMKSPRIAFAHTSQFHTARQKGSPSDCSHWRTGGFWRTHVRTSGDRSRCQPVCQVVPKRRTRLAAFVHCSPPQPFPKPLPRHRRGSARLAAAAAIGAVCTLRFLRRIEYDIFYKSAYSCLTVKRLRASPVSRFSSLSATRRRKVPAGGLRRQAPCWRR